MGTLKVIIFFLQLIPPDTPEIATRLIVHDILFRCIYISYIETVDHHYILRYTRQLTSRNLLVNIQRANPSDSHHWMTRKSIIRSLLSA